MRSVGPTRTRIVVGFLSLVAIVGVVVALLARISRNGSREALTWSRSSPEINSATVPPVSSAPTPEANPGFPAPAPTPNASPSLQIYEGPSPAGLIIPVAGVRPEQLLDTFSESRSEGRVHDAIDIAAPLGTSVLAAADGKIVRLFNSERGGITVYQLSTDEKFVYYYAHLDRYADGLTAGHLARQGETIAYVGNSGNAGAGNYHLHFSIALISNPKNFWQGVNINPYPLLKK
jgi:murein DD-endopeptidase MepM/ murein hydrolase activator NlpD